MTLLGLGLTQLGAIFGAAAALLVALYILKLRRRRIEVPFSKLWLRVINERESTTLFRRLKRLLSLLLQLAFLALLTGALGDPRLSDAVLEGRRIVLLLDTSASMKAHDGDDGDRMTTAITRAKEIARGMAGADSMMIVRMDAQVTPITPFTGDDKTLLKVLSDVRASDTRADLARGLRFCADALRGRKNPVLILVGDGAYDPELLKRVLLGDPSKPGTGAGASTSTKRGPAEDLDQIDLRGVAAHFIAVGRAQDNVGIVAFSARRYPANKLSYEVFLDVVNNRPATANKGAATEVDLQLYVDGVLSDVQRLRLKPGERARYSCGTEDRGPQRRWCDQAASGELLEARLARPGATGADGEPRLDVFDVDDRAFALLPRRRKQKVLLVSQGSLFLEGALLLDENTEFSRVAPAAYTPAALKGFDAVVLDGFFPEQPPPIHTLVVAPPTTGPALPYTVKGTLQSPLITEQNTEHPVMRWITLKDVNIGSSATFKRRPGDVVLAASFRAPLMFAREQRGKKLVVLGFDPRRSDLPLRVAFPILFINTFNWFAGEGQELVTTYRTGRTWRVPLAGAAGAEDDAPPLTVIDPAGHSLRAALQGGNAVLYGEQVGVYRIKRRDGELKIAANLADAEESKIAAKRELVLGGHKLEPPRGFGVALRREIWIYLLLAAVALTMFEWLTYNRRMTV